MKHSHPVNIETVEGCHCQHVLFWVEVIGHCLTDVVHLLNRRAFVGNYWTAYRVFFIVELELGVAAIVDIDQVEAIVVVSGQDGIAAGGARDIEPVKNAVVLEHLAKFTLDAVLNSDGADRFFRIAYVPHFYC